LKRKKHSIYIFINNEDAAFSSGITILISDQPSGPNILNQLKTAATVSAKNAISLLSKTLIDLFKYYLILWIVSYQIAVSVVENSVFRDLVGLHSITLAEALPASGNIVCKWITDYFEVKKTAFLTIYGIIILAAFIYPSIYEPHLINASI